MMSRLVILAASLSVACATTSATNSESWAQVGDRIFHLPKNGEYYYAQAASSDALPDELQTHRVASQGRYHIFHFPAGAPPASLAKGTRQGRRSSVSSLVQLTTGTVLDTQFPPYESPATYKNPLSAADQKLEHSGAETIKATDIMADLTTLTTFPTRSWTNADESKQVENFLLKKFQKMGKDYGADVKTCLHIFDHSYGGEKLANVVAFIQGTGEGAITVGAHYDSRPFDGAAPGADDNGSGVAALLAIAKAYMSTKVKSTKSVYFVGFAGEEDGLDGSAAFTSTIFGKGLPAECTSSKNVSSSFLQSKTSVRTEKKADHRAIILDEVGWESSKFTKPTLNIESYDWADEVMNNIASASKDINGDKLALTHSSNPFGSDHMSFLDKEVPAALMINADDEAYPDYHKKTDKIENVNGDYIEMIAKASFGGLMRLAAK